MSSATAGTGWINQEIYRVGGVDYGTEEHGVCLFRLPLRTLRRWGEESLADPPKRNRFLGRVLDVLEVPCPHWKGRARRVHAMTDLGVEAGFKRGRLYRAKKALGVQQAPAPGETGRPAANTPVSSRFWYWRFEWQELPASRQTLEGASARLAASTEERTGATKFPESAASLPDAKRPGRRKGSLDPAARRRHKLIVDDWNAGRYKSVAELARAYHVDRSTASKILKQAGLKP